MERSPAARTGAIVKCCGWAEVEKGGVLGLKWVLSRPFSPGVRHHARSYRRSFSLYQPWRRRTPWSEILRVGAQRLLTQAVEQEVAQWIDSHQHVTDEAGHRQVVRNGRLPKRTILTGVGPVSRSSSRGYSIVGPKHDAEPFSSQDSSAVLPAQKTKSLEELIPWLYLKGISTGRFQRSPRGVGRARGQGAVGHDDRAAEEQLGGRIPGVERAVSGGQAVRLHLGRWRAFQHSPGGRPAVHPWC